MVKDAETVARFIVCTANARREFPAASDGKLDGVVGTEIRKDG